VNVGSPGLRWTTVKRGNDSVASRARREVLSVRVSGCPGRTGKSPLAAREENPRATSSGKVVAVGKDRGFGFRENRPGLNRPGLNRLRLPAVVVWRWCG